ncbi:MAG: phenylalanyl-tRNA synthetase, beta subunit [Candidatus Doudnabacteria bacterium]|nr:phenylalanyl-tRNA synthetase, beta subunit [Candidatus Doudnabacteria bacterium]
MKISYNWLSELVDLKKIKPELLSKQIAEHCFEVEKLISSTDQKFQFSNVIIAKVLHFEKHPNADRLRVVKLEIGGGKIIDPVVCGANNFVEGDLVALALPGAVIPQNIHSEKHETFVLEKAVIRGVESQGMICAAFELGLVNQPEERPEILILPKTAKLGMKLEDHLTFKQKKSDFILELALPANRPDLFSHLGIAREISGILDLKKLPYANGLEKKDKISVKAKKKLEIELKDKELCSYYLGAKIKVKIGPSPLFIKERLEAIGLRSVNNVVDITNYVMHEVGEPLHAFDAKFVQEKIIVRKAHAGEEFTTIDHKNRKLDHEMLVISDTHKTLAIAGIMGGVESEVTEKTEEIILEAANFNAASIRKTSKQLGLRTDASALWEKGLHPKQAIIGLNRALELLKEYANAEVLEFSEVGKIEEKKKLIKFNPKEINSLLGTDFEPTKIKQFLTRVGLKIQGANALAAEVPYYRTEMYDYADLADEILKITGTNDVEKKALQIQKVTFEINEDKPFVQAKELMVGFGFNEVQNYSFVSEDDINKSGKEGENRHLKVKNPLSGEQAFLKRTLLIPILKNIRDNSRYFEAFKLFEIGKGYLSFLNEVDLLTFMVYDKNLSNEMLLAKTKGYLEEFVSRYHKDPIKYRSMKGSLVTVSCGNIELGSIGLVDGTMMRNFDLPNPAAFASLDLEKLWSSKKPTAYNSYSKFPGKVLDVSMFVEKDFSWSRALEVINQYGGNYLVAVQIFEADYLYSQNKLPEFHRKLIEKNQRNIAFHLVFQAPDRTLKDSEVSPIYDKIVGELQSKLNAEIR